MKKRLICVALSWMSLASTAWGQAVVCQTNPVIFGTGAIFTFNTAGISTPMALLGFE